jgi:alpha-tubulin suppressor-like RCC1 family protein
VFLVSSSLAGCGSSEGSGGKPKGDSPSDGGSGGSGHNAGGESGESGSGGDGCVAEDPCKAGWVCGNAVDDCGVERSCGECDEGLLCSDHACVAECDGCAISGNCFSPGEVNPEAPCEVCSPALSTDAFSPISDGTTCDDGNACSSNDTCQEGVCSGIAADCDDGVACNGTEACDSQSGECSLGTSTCATGVCDPALDDCVADCSAGCLVQGVCYAAGSTHPSTPCFVCDPARSSSALSPNQGAVCEDDGDPCLFPGACNSEGTCERAPRDQGTACGAGITECASSTCDGEGSCVTEPSPSDVLCSGTAGICKAPHHCDGGGQCTPGGALPLGSECGSNAECSGDQNAPACTCISGYEPSANGCVDIDECAKGLDDCDGKPEACVNTPGSYDCQCAAPFVGDGVGSQGCSCERDDYSELCEPWTHVSTANLSTCAISAGALFCWGDNSEGQLATGNRVDRTLPARSGTAQNWDFVDMGYDHACGIREGELYCWGNDALGALGHDGNGLVPARVGTASDWVTVSAGLASSCGIRGDGDLYCWGWNSYGQVGVGSEEGYFKTPQLVMNGVERVSVNMAHVCAIRTGRLYCWGDNEVEQSLPTRVTDFEDWTAVGLDQLGVCAVRAGGALYCWDSGAEPELFPEPDGWSHITREFVNSCGLVEGGNAYCSGINLHGQLGNGTTKSGDAPVPVSGAGGWEMVEAGREVSFGIRDGGLYGWGSNELGLRGTGFLLGRVGTATDWLAVSTSNSYSCGLREPGDLYCWGRSFSDSDDGAVTRIGTASDWSRIDTGWSHVCGIRQGALYCFGGNWDGQLGDGTFTDSAEPIQVGTASNWVDVSASKGAAGHTCAVNADGELACWGDNAHGQLGDGTTEARTTPHTLAGVGWTAVSTGTGYTCGVMNGGLYCWGDPSSMKLGFTASANQLTPKRVGTSSGWTSVSTGFDSACGLLAGAPQCWGSNTFGQLGNGSGSIAENIAGTATRITSGTFTACTIDSSGSLYCWGNNNFGQLATGDFTRRSAPALVAGSPGWQEISNEGYHSCGIREGALYCWGRNQSGSLGTGEGLTPMPVENGL